MDASTATRDHVGWRYVPDETITAQMNLSYATSVALIDGTCFVDQFAGHRLSDPRILDLASRFEVRADPEIDAKGRGARHEVRVRIDLRDGRRIEGHADVPRGSAGNPLGPDEITGKFMDLASRQIGADAARELLALVNRIDELGDLAPLWKLLRRAGA